MTTQVRPAVGTTAWRIAPSGTQACFVNRFMGDQVSICTPGMKQRWSLRPMTIPAADVFADRAAARAEFRNRKRNPSAIDAIDGFRAEVARHLTEMGESDLTTATENVKVLYAWEHEIGPRDTACQIQADRADRREG